jgi:hypothetical protein
MMDLSLRNMDMRFGTWNVRSPYRECSLRRFGGNYPDISFILWECRRSDGRAVAPHQQEGTHISVERGLRTMNWVQGFSYVRGESYQQLRGLNLLVIGYHT